MDEDVWPKLKFINEKNIKRLKENWHNDFTFLGEDFVVRINISFPVLLCYDLIDMRLKIC